jgi:hypothetical protein
MPLHGNHNSWLITHNHRFRKGGVKGMKFHSVAFEIFGKVDVDDFHVLCLVGDYKA